jgi:hypothetical protein
MAVQLCTGVEERAGNDHFQIYPNPATDQLTISNIKAEPFSWQLTGIDGRIIRQTNVIEATRKTEISLTDLPRGIYFIRILADGQVLQQMRLVISD